MWKQLTGLLLMIPAALQAASYFPIEFGNSWTYRNNVTGRSFTVRVGTPVMTNDKVYYTLRGFVGFQHSGPHRRNQYACCMSTTKPARNGPLMIF